MVKIPTPHPVDWVMPAPLWDGALEAAASSSLTKTMRRPVLLTIDNDQFMEVLRRQLADDPARLSSLEATPVSYRVRPPGRPDDWEPPGAQVPLKLYQAAHGHYNLIAATLMCKLPGLPEHLVHPELREQVAFVIRRLDSGIEFAWTGDASTGMSWQPVAGGAEKSVGAGEQLLPMFPVNYTLEGRPRRLLVGVVPTSSVETYNEASSTQPPPNTPPPPPRALMEMAFNTRVGSVLDQYASLFDDPAPPGGPPVQQQASAGSPMLVLEFASFLADWFPSSWAAVSQGLPAPVNAPLYAALNVLNADTGITWLQALRTAWTQRDALTGEGAAAAAPLTLNVAQKPSQATTLVSLLPTPEVPGTSVPGAAVARAPKIDPRGQLKYVLRCVYRRPECVVDGEVVSEETDAFEIATHFDFDAPARPVTISLPQLTSLSDLRKFKKNVNFLLSQELHNQIDRIIDLPNTLKGNFNGPTPPGSGLQVGWICSFSIPIVTICALIVLIMMVIALNLVFWWLPFFEVCVPVPKK